MSLPIPTSLLVLGATTLAADVAKRVGHAIGFAEVLAGPDSTTPGSVPSESAPSDAASLIDQIVEAVRQTLRRSDITVNRSLNLSVQAGGGLRVEQDHPRAAEIESLLRGDQRLMDLAAKLAEMSGDSESAIGLTIPGHGDNILRAPGGYPNW